MAIGEKGTTYYKHDVNGTPHKGTRQDFTPGNKVNIGWNKDLEVVGEHPHGGVVLKKNDQHYHFIPHQGGLNKIDKPPEGSERSHPQPHIMKPAELASHQYKFNKAYGEGHDTKALGEGKEFGEK